MSFWLVGDALDRYGRIDVLVNNVGGVRLDGFLQVTEDVREQNRSDATRALPDRQDSTWRIWPGC
jgi:NAD(P)-dependent dehydrogenase (short-subunit alcohol dehydrogenase family)